MHDQPLKPRAGSPPPPAAVREAWGVDTLKPLDGGQGMAFVGGGVRAPTFTHSSLYATRSAFR